MSEGALSADTDRYRRAAAMNTPPPQVVSDPVIAGSTPIEQLLQILVMAANMGDAADNTSSAEQHAEREAKANDAAEKFSGQDQRAADRLGDLADVRADALDGPQIVSGVAGALAGALGSALQPLAQIPQQAGQGVQQAIQAGTGLVAQIAGRAAVRAEEADFAEPAGDEELSSHAGDLTGLNAQDSSVSEMPGTGDDWGGGGFGGTAPTAFLGPPPVPSASTAPASAPVAPVAPTPIPATAPAASGMAAMPMVPPGPMPGPGAGRPAPAETKRVSAPPVRNGAPVQGRLSPPASLPTLTPGGRPVVTRRIIAPGSRDGDPSADSTSDTGA